MQLLIVDAGVFLKTLTPFFGYENMKKLSSKVAHNWPQMFFSVLQTGPITAQISFFSMKMSP